MLLFSKIWWRVGLWWGCKEWTRGKCISVQYLWNWHRKVTLSSSSPFCPSLICLVRESTATAQKWNIIEVYAIQLNLIFTLLMSLLILVGYTRVLAWKVSNKTNYLSSQEDGRKFYSIDAQLWVQTKNSSSLSVDRGSRVQGPYYPCTIFQRHKSKEEWKHF